MAIASVRSRKSESVRVMTMEIEAQSTLINLKATLSGGGVK